jgi:hypothetical protein
MALTISKLIRTGIVGVVHEVANRVLAGVVWASVAASGATERRAGLRRCVSNKISIALAATLEGIVKTGPVANLVCKGLRR